jgi:AcrR family transcriptional regulator
MSARSSNARGRKTRDRLLAAARRILETQGFESLTMSALGDEAGITRRAVYSHFDSRAQLVGELFDHVARTERLGESVARVWSAASATAALDEWARHLARYHPRVIAVDRAVDRVRHVDADAARHWRHVQRAKRANCRRLAAWLSRSGELASPWTLDSAADMLCALVSSDIIETLLVTRSWSRRDLSRHLSVLLRATFVSKG